MATKINDRILYMKLTSFIWFLNFGILSNFFACQAIKAQIIPDNSLPDNSIVTPDGEVIQIEGGTKRGNNLFHSFEEFSVPTNNTASFNNAVDIQNIFSRITGNSISEIDGVLEAQGAANLFLINPNGIVFGEDAALNIGGSFLGTTAESVHFKDGTQFNTTDKQTKPLLTITAPVGLGLGNNPGQIINRSFALDFFDEFQAGLQVQSGNTIALLGGEIVLDGGAITADEGKVELGAVAENNLVDLVQDKKGWNLSYGKVVDFKDISLFQESIISSFGNIGADIQVYGKNVSITEGSQIFSVSFLSEAGNLVVEGTESVLLSGFESGLFNEVEETASGKNGTLNITTKELSVVDSALVSTATSGTEVGSNLIIKSEELTVKNGGQILTSTLGEGNAGNLTIIASNLIFLEGRIEIEGEDGNLKYPSSGIFAQVEPKGTGNGGNLSIETSQLTVLDGAQISTNARNQGQGGNINLDVSDSITLSGTSSVGDVETSRSVISTSAQPEATNNSGSLELNTELLIVENGAILSANNRGTGTGGNASINVDRLIVRDGGEIGAGSLVDDDATNDIRGAGGNLTIEATDSIQVIGMGAIRKKTVNSSIFTRSEGTGDSGNLKIFTPDLTVGEGGNIDVSATGTGEAGSLGIDAQNITLERGSLTAKTRVGDEGNITLDNADTLLLRNNSQITTNATESATGGDIFIGSEGIALLDNSDITANAVQGQGGNIQITTQGIFQEPDSNITAASQLGIDGTVTFNTPDVDPASGIFELPDVPIDAENILAQDLCKLEDEKIAKGSSFVVTGKGGLTPTSEGSLYNRDRLINWARRDDLKVSEDGAVGIRQRESQDTADKSYPDIKQAQGLVVAADGSTWLTANAYNTVPRSSNIHPDCQASKSKVKNRSTR